MRRWIAAALAGVLLSAGTALADGTPGVGVPRVLALPVPGRFLVTVSVYPDTPRVGRIVVLLLGVAHSGSARPFRGGVRVVVRQPGVGPQAVPVEQVAAGEYQGQYLARGRPGEARISLRLRPRAGGAVQVEGGFPQRSGGVPPWAQGAVGGLVVAMLAAWAVRLRRGRSERA